MIQVMLYGLYYKHVTIVNDDSSIVSKWSFKLIDDPRVIIYERHRFIIKATNNTTVNRQKTLNLTSNQSHIEHGILNVNVNLIFILIVPLFHSCCD
jgi:hypothetical protein